MWVLFTVQMSFKGIYSFGFWLFQMGSFGCWRYVRIRIWVFKYVDYVYRFFWSLCKDAKVFWSKLLVNIFCFQGQQGNCAVPLSCPFFFLVTVSLFFNYIIQSSALPPQPPPKESFARPYKFLWPMLLAVNLAVGGPILFLIHQLYNSLYILISYTFMYVGVY